MTIRILIISIIFPLHTAVLAAIIDSGDIIDCQPTEQQFIVDSQVNNLLPLTNPSKIRFTVMSDQSIEAILKNKTPSPSILNGAKYVGEEIFTSIAGELKVSKWSKADKYQSEHNLYFAIDKNKEIILEERISKDHFKRMFVISYTCKVDSLTAKSSKSNANDRNQNLESLISKSNEDKSNDVTQAIHNPITNLNNQKAYNQTDKNQKVENNLKQQFKCSGSYKYKINSKATQSAPAETSIMLIYEKEEGRFELPFGWDKYTENGLTAWIDQRENIRQSDRKNFKKVNLYATLETIDGASSTFLILRTDTLNLFVKYEKLPTGLIDSFEGICTRLN